MLQGLASESFRTFKRSHTLGPRKAGLAAGALQCFRPFKYSLLASSLINLRIFINFDPATIDN
ncbi:hypothetical protein D0866_05900 [Hortaea werneckii]|uniref:Uncharacterized protein n=1 Tax=Hortaea werneckii TaxID=91943 RepID=A0A3M7B151_HORWE|nr:hypothetical protein D0866_05900 [Hortaea werneckii]